RPDGLRHTSLKRGAHGCFGCEDLLQLLAAAFGPTRPRQASVGGSADRGQAAAPSSNRRDCHQAVIFAEKERLPLASRQAMLLRYQIASQSTLKRVGSQNL